MHIPAKDAVTDPEILRSFISAHPLGLLSTYVPSDKYAALQASHIPFTLAQRGDQWLLQAHMAAANPQSKALRAAFAAGDPVADVLVTFTAPTHGHVSASFFAETKPKEGKIVPTWDYAAVQVYGPIKVFSHSPEQEDETEKFLSEQTAILSDKHEAGVVGIDGKPKKPWAVSDAPAKYLAGMRKAIVGIEIPIAKIEGRFKLSQHNSQGDWEGIVRGHLANGHEPLAGLTLSRGRAAGLSVPHDLQAFANSIPHDVVQASEP